MYKDKGERASLSSKTGNCQLYKIILFCFDEKVSSKLLVCARTISNQTTKAFGFGVDHDAKALPISLPLNSLILAFGFNHGPTQGPVATGTTEL